MSRPAIPEQIKREVRQRCGFGCVLCGCPVFDYDHLVEYNEVLKHEAANIILLCPAHHADKTRGRLAIARVAAANAQPFNIGRVMSGVYKLEPARNIEVALGKNKEWADFAHVDWHHVLTVNEHFFIALECIDGWVTLTATVTDAKGKVLLGIDAGELTVSQGIWDFNYVGTRLKIRQGKGEIVLDMELSDTRFAVHYGCFIDPRGDGFTVTKDGTLNTLVGGIVCGTQEGGEFGGNAAGWGLFNYEYFNPFRKTPPGYGSKRTVPFKPWSSPQRAREYQGWLKDLLDQPS